MKKQTKTNSKSNTPKLEAFCHGEALIIRGVSIPANAEPFKPTNSEYNIIADSETTGNHHVVDNAGVNWFKADGVLFAEVTKETNVRCIHADRHSTRTLTPGTYEFGFSQEYDHAEQHSRNVKD